MANLLGSYNYKTNKMKNIHKIDSEIYIISDEEIKVGDYRLNNQRDYFKKADKEGLDYYNKRNDVFKKIILTTDLDLIKDGVQAIDDEFLQWFVKNPSCEEVKTDLVPVNEFGSEVLVTSYRFDRFIYKMVSVKEIKPYLVLVDAKAEQNNTTDLNAYANGVEDGAKWMQERSYTEKEVIAIVEKSRKTGLTAEYLIKQFKKK